MNKFLLLASNSYKNKAIPLHFFSSVSNSVDFQKDLWIPQNGLGISEKSLQRWNNKNINPYTLKGDVLADQVVADLVKSNNQKWYKDFMRLSLTNKEELPSEYPSILRDYVHSHKLPVWTDKSKLKEGHLLYSRFALPIASILSWSSLPMLYSFKTGVEVLAKTGEITNNFGSRVLNTVRLVTAVGDSNGFEDSGKAIKTISKVRLTHAFVRYHLLHSEEKWDIEKFNIPINQRDQVVTLNSFSSLIIDGLERLRVDFEPREIEGYLHLWNVTGSIIGIEDYLLPQDLEDGYGTLRYATREFTEKCDSGVACQKALILYLEKKTVGKLGDGIHEVMMNFLLGEKVCNALGMQKSNNWTRMLIPFMKMGMKYYDDVGDNSKFLAKNSGFVMRNSLKIMAFIMRQGKMVDFELAKKVEQKLKM